MTTVKLPGLWLDDFTTSSAVGIFVANQYPQDNGTDFARDGAIELEVLSTAPSGVDISATTVYIDGVAALLNGVFQTGFVTGSSITNINVHDYRIVIAHDDDFDSEATVTVRVVSQTLDTVYSVDTTYTFAVEDYTAPALVSVTAIASDTLRVVFSEGMLASSASGSTDALNPSNYDVEYEQQNEHEAAVWVVPESVEQVSPTTYDVTTDIDLTFWRRYSLTVGGIADDSINGNLVAGTVFIEFDSWVPPDWPEDRRFVLWDLMGDDDRDGDTHGALERLLDVFQDVVNMRLYDIDRFETLWDVDTAPISFIRAMLQDLGNPFDIDVSDIKLRRLVTQLAPSYAQKGTESAIVNLARFFLGLTVSVYAHNDNTERWILEDVSVTDVEGYDGGLGIDSVLGPEDGSAALYTFVVYSGIVLTTEQRRQLSAIIEEVKCAHEHYIITDPSDAPEYDPWEIGLSYLGDDTYLHD